METVKKKRGRKPKNFFNENIELVMEKKKRGRKKKYEIENYYKIVNRNEDNNFNHNIVYSDDDETVKIEDTSTRKIAFGNLDITVSKKVPIENSNFKFIFNEKIIINENEYSDEEVEVPIENFIKKNEKNYNEIKTYIPKIVSECKEINTLKKFKIITTIKNLNFTEMPEKTDINCWWCCHKFESCPCSCPIDCKKGKFDCIGVFCSWNCVKAYHYYTVDYKKKFSSMELINQLMMQLYGVTKTLSTKPAPPRQCLDIFGGYMNINQFRENNVLNYRLNLINSNFIFPEITEINTIKVKPNENKNLRLTRPNQC